MSNRSPGHPENQPSGDVPTPAWVVNPLQVLNPMLSGLQAWQGKGGKAVAALNTEWLTFVNRRIHEDFSLPHQLGSAKTPEEMWRVYAGFWEHTLDDYQAEYKELLRLSSDAATESLAALHRSGHDAGDPVAPRTPRH